MSALASSPSFRARARSARDPESSERINGRELSASTGDINQAVTLILISLALLVALQPCRADDITPARTSELGIVTASGQTWEYSVEVAGTSGLRRRGLMFREVLPADQGMLLLYESPREVNIWMKNTPISLDIVFIDRDGVITRVAANAAPYSEEIIPSGGDARAVLEINGGQAGSRGIREGDRVIYPPLWPAPQ